MKFNFVLSLIHIVIVGSIGARKGDDFIPASAYLVDSSRTVKLGRVYLYQKQENAKYLKLYYLNARLPLIESDDDLKNKFHVRVKENYLHFPFKYIKNIESDQKNLNIMLKSSDNSEYQPFLILNFDQVDTTFMNGLNTTHQGYIAKRSSKISLLKNMKNSLLAAKSKLAKIKNKIKNKFNTTKKGKKHRIDKRNKTKYRNKTFNKHF
jgi:hypothetical protein